MKRKKMIGNKGFTLVELIIVLAISALILVFMLFSYSLITNNSVTKSARRLENVLRQAKTNAMSKGQAAGVVRLDVDGGVCYAIIGEGTDAEESVLISGSGVVVTSTLDELPDPATIGETSTGATIVFNTNGRLKMAGTTRTTGKNFVFSSGKHMYKVVVHKETGAIECGVFTVSDNVAGEEGH